MTTPAENFEHRCQCAQAMIRAVADGAAELDEAEDLLVWAGLNFDRARFAHAVEAYAAAEAINADYGVAGNYADIPAGVNIAAAAPIIADQFDAEVVDTVRAIARGAAA